MPLKVELRQAVFCMLILLTIDDIIQLFVALASNALEVYTIPQPTRSKESSPEAARIYSVDLPGHRHDVRTLCLSSDDLLLASAANGTLVCISMWRLLIWLQAL